MSVRTSLVAAAVIALTATALTLPSAADASSPSVRFSKAYYNSPGADTGSNTSLNGEWVRITNYSSSKKTLTGWTVRDKQNHVYKFGTFSLSSGSSVTLYTGKGTNAWNKRYWGQTAYIWNNTGDAASLRTSSGSSVDSCSWGSSGSSTTC
ncbi:MAG: lamin tail domain-containing protein [Marmoricola sp.]